jgi:hypothetical protein
MAESLQTVLETSWWILQGAQMQCGHAQDIHWVGSAWLKASIPAETQTVPMNPPEITITVRVQTVARMKTMRVLTITKMEMLRVRTMTRKKTLMRVRTMTRMET